MTTALKHTPGPWESGLNPKGGYSNGVVVRPAGEFPHGLWIADCGCDADDERIANAKLIAAAPEMLLALKTVDQFLDHLSSQWEVCWHTKTMIEEVKNCIAKAEDTQG